MNDQLERSVETLARLAREEDFGSGDITTALLPESDRPATFALFAKQPCVIAGRGFTPIILRAYDVGLEIEWSAGVEDGAIVTDPGSLALPTGGSGIDAGVILATVTGSLRSVLAIERVLLNFLQRLCGIATLTRRFVDAVHGTDVLICDTRKTTPGWRLLEKYAVRCGGGTNHRIGLFDGVLIKDNHLHSVPASRLAASVFEMLNQLPERTDSSSLDRPFIEVEVDSLEQFEALLSVVGIDAILLDNFKPAQLHAAVALRNDFGLTERVLLEASGGITLETVRRVAETGVNRISIGALTHSAPAVDLSLERVE